MKALVTGGCGFIGSHLVDNLLARNFEVAIVDNMMRGHYLWDKKNGPSLFENSILDRDALAGVFRSVRPDAVFHLAAHHYIPFCEKNPHDAFLTNVTGTLNIVESCTRCDSVGKYFFASTGDVYAPSGYAHREGDTPSPVYVYGETKLIGEAIAKRYKNSVGASFDITLGRLFNAAGTRETNPHLLPEVLRQLMAGAKTIEVGNTWPVRDFVDVTTMAKVIAELTLKNKGLDTFNIGSGKTQTVREALDLLIEGQGKSAEIISVPQKQRPNDRPYLCPAVDKTKSYLGFAAEPFSRTTVEAIWNSPPEQRIMYD